MGGHVLEHEGKTIYKKGIMQEKCDVAVRLYEMGYEIETIATAVSISLYQVKKWVNTPVAKAIM